MDSKMLTRLGVALAAVTMSVDACSPPVQHFTGQPPAPLSKTTKSEGSSSILYPFFLRLARYCTVEPSPRRLHTHVHINGNRRTPRE